MQAPEADAEGAMSEQQQPSLRDTKQSSGAAYPGNDEPLGQAVGISSLLPEISIDSEGAGIGPPSSSAGSRGAAPAAGTAAGKPLEVLPDSRDSTPETEQLASDDDCAAHKPPALGNTSVQGSAQQEEQRSSLSQQQHDRCKVALGNSNPVEAAAAAGPSASVHPKAAQYTSSGAEGQTSSGDPMQQSLPEMERWMRDVLKDVLGGLFGTANQDQQQQKLEVDDKLRALSEQVEQLSGVVKAGQREQKKQGEDLEGFLAEQQDKFQVQEHKLEEASEQLGHLAQSQTVLSGSLSSLSASHSASSKALREQLTDLKEGSDKLIAGLQGELAACKQQLQALGGSAAAHEAFLQQLRAAGASLEGRVDQLVAAGAAQQQVLGQLRAAQLTAAQAKDWLQQLGHAVGNTLAQQQQQVGGWMGQLQRGLANVEGLLNSSVAEMELCEEDALGTAPGGPEGGDAGDGLAAAEPSQEQPAASGEGQETGGEGGKQLDDQLNQAGAGSHNPKVQQVQPDAADAAAAVEVEEPSSSSFPQEAALAGVGSSGADGGGTAAAIPQMGHQLPPLPLQAAGSVSQPLVGEGSSALGPVSSSHTEQTLLFRASSAPATALLNSGGPVQQPQALTFKLRFLGPTASGTCSTAPPAAASLQPDGDAGAQREGAPESSMAGAVNAAAAAGQPGSSVAGAGGGGARKCGSAADPAAVDPPAPQPDVPPANASFAGAVAGTGATTAATSPPDFATVLAAAEAAAQPTSLGLIPNPNQGAAAAGGVGPARRRGLGGNPGEEGDGFGLGFGGSYAGDDPGEEGEDEDEEGGSRGKKLGEGTKRPTGFPASSSGQPPRPRRQQNVSSSRGQGAPPPAAARTAAVGGPRRGAGRAGSLGQEARGVRAMPVVDLPGMRHRVTRGNAGGGAQAPGRAAAAAIASGQEGMKEGMLRAHSISNEDGVLHQLTHDLAGTALKDSSRQGSLVLPAEPGTLLVPEGQQQRQEGGRVNRRAQRHGAAAAEAGDASTAGAEAAAAELVGTGEHGEGMVGGGRSVRNSRRAGGHPQAAGEVRQRLPRDAGIAAAEKITEMFQRRAKLTKATDDAVEGEGAAAAGGAEVSGAPGAVLLGGAEIQLGEEPAWDAAGSDDEMEAAEEVETPPSAAASDADGDDLVMEMEDAEEGDRGAPTALDADAVGSAMDLESLDGGDVEAAAPASVTMSPAGSQQAGALGHPMSEEQAVAAAAAGFPPAAPMPPLPPSQAGYLSPVEEQGEGLDYNGDRGEGEGAGRGRHAPAGGRGGAGGGGRHSHGGGGGGGGGGVSRASRAAQAAARIVERAKEQKQSPQGSKRRANRDE